MLKARSDFVAVGLSGRQIKLETSFPLCMEKRFSLFRPYKRFLELLNKTQFNA